MVEFDIKIERFRDKETGELVSGRQFRTITQAAFAISKDAKRSIKNSPTASRAGRPPKTRRGRLRFAIRYHADQHKKRAVIGPRASITGKAGSSHEFGGRYESEQFPERPFMAPALERNAHRK